MDKKFMYDKNDVKEIIIDGKKFVLYRIVATTNFLTRNNNYVTYGQKGGYCAVGSLSLDGLCWVDEKSMVGPGCYISGDAQVENSCLAHDCTLGERAVVSNSKIYPAFNATLRQNSRVYDSEIRGSLQMKEDASIIDSKVKGRLQMEGQTYLIDSEIVTSGNGIVMVGGSKLTNVEVHGKGTVGISKLIIKDKTKAV